MLKEYPELEGAWRRGRFLRHLRRLAASGTTVAEAAHHLGLGAASDLQEQIVTDIEVAGIWNEARLETAVDVKEQWLEKAKAGNARAMAQVETALRNEIAHAAMDIHTVPEEKMCEIAGVARMTLNRWLREKGMPRNAGEATYDLPAVWSWFEGFVKSRVTGTTPPAIEPLRAEKVRTQALRNAELEGRLWDRETVLAGLQARARLLAETLSAAKASELGQRLAGQPAPQIARILEDFFTDARGAACRIPDDCKLPAAAAAVWTKLIEALEAGKETR